MQNVYEKLISCYESIREKIPFTPRVALVLGSGLGDYAEKIRVEAELDYHEIDGFPVSTVPGHADGSGAFVSDKCLRRDQSVVFCRGSDAADGSHFSVCTQSFDRAEF